MTPADARKLLERLLHQIAPEADLGDVDFSAPLQEELDLDSMDFLNLVTAVHDETGLEIPESDYPKLSSAEGFIDYLTARASSMSLIDTIPTSAPSSTTGR